MYCVNSGQKPLKESSVSPMLRKYYPTLFDNEVQIHIDFLIKMSMEPLILFSYYRKLRRAWSCLNLSQPPTIPSKVKKKKKSETLIIDSN